MKNILITGTSSGIGLELLKVFLKENYRVFPLVRNAVSAKIINISSRRGSITDTASGQYRVLYPYQIAKSAQNMLTACLNQELEKEGILTSPFTDTKLRFIVHNGISEKDIDEIVQLVDKVISRR